MTVWRLVAVLALVSGLVGLTACAAGVYAVWRVESRVQYVNDRVFDLFDDGLSTIRERVRRAADRVRQSRLTSDEVVRALKDRTVLEARNRLITQLEIENRAEKLAGQIRTADVWLDTSQQTARDVRQLLELSRTLGARVDAAALDEVLDSLTSLRDTLAQAEQSVEELRLFAANVNIPEEDRLARIAAVAARVAATLLEIAPRLDRLEARLAERQDDSRRLGETAGRWIRWTAIACTAILVWVAAGQLCLCGWGRRRWRGGRQAV